MSGVLGDQVKGGGLVVVCGCGSGWGMVVVCGNWGRMVSLYFLDAFGHFLDYLLWEVGNFTL